MAFWPCYSPAQEKTSDSALLTRSPYPVYQFAVAAVTIATNLVAIKTTETYSFCSGGPQVWQGCAPSGDHRGEAIPCLFQPLVAISMP